jgi:hypothetical protein
VSTLTDRYVWAVLREVPESQRPELEPEIRALVADAIEARAGREADATARERAALLELGEPDFLAARYADKTMYLIGPRLFPEWRRLLTMLVPLVSVIVGIVAGAAGFIDGRDPVGAVVGGITAGVMVAIQTVFWITLVFAVIERAGSQVPSPLPAWSPDHLPELPVAHRVGIAEAAASIAVSAFAAAALIWQQALPPVVIDGTAFTIFNPALWSFWLPYFLVVLILQGVHQLALYLRGRWTWGFAVVNAALNVAFAVPAIWLLQTDQLINADLAAKLNAVGGGQWFGPTMSIAAIVVAIVTAIDSVDGLRKAWQNARPRGLQVTTA